MVATDCRISTCRMSRNLMRGEKYSSKLAEYLMVKSRGRTDYATLAAWSLEV